MKRILLSLLVCSFPLFAQKGIYTAEYKASGLSVAASVVTVQLARSADAKSVQMADASIYCSVSCEITLERDGTSASTTAITPAALRTSYPTVKATAYRSSNAGVGTVLARYVVAPGATLTVDLSDIQLVPATAAENFTIRTASITGDAYIVVKWKEF